MTHTPGPWIIGGNAPDYTGRCTIRDWEGWDIAQIPGLKMDQPHPRQDANTKLIAAAPELLEALEEMRIFAEGIRAEWQNENPGKEYNPLRVKLIAQARQAIAKAKGE